MLLLHAAQHSADAQHASLVPLETDVPTCAVGQGAHLEGAAFLVSLPDDELLVLPSSDAHFLPHHEDAEVLRKHASAVAASWRRERYRVARRVRIPDWLMVYVDELHAATARDDVCHALLASAPLVVGGFAAVVFLSADANGATPLRPIQEPTSHVAVPTLSAVAATLFTDPCVVLTELEVSGASGGAYAFLGPLLSAFGAAQLVCAPVADGALLVLIERRRDRVFTSEDRDLLQWLTKQARRRLAEITTHDREGT